MIIGYPAPGAGILAHGPPIPLAVAGAHQVNFALARPLPLMPRRGPALNARNGTWFAQAFPGPVPAQPVSLVPIGDSRRAGGGAVTELLVANWTAPGIVETPIALMVVIGPTFLNATFGRLNAPPTPLPVVVILTPGAFGMHPTSMPFLTFAPLTFGWVAGVIDPATPGPE